MLELHHFDESLWPAEPITLEDVDVRYGLVGRPRPLRAPATQGGQLGRPADELPAIDIHSL
jgi:hypothetical protein